MKKTYRGPLAWFQRWNFKRVERRRWYRELLEGIPATDAALLEGLTFLVEKANAEASAREAWQAEVERQLAALADQVAGKVGDRVAEQLKATNRDGFPVVATAQPGLARGSELGLAAEPAKAEAGDFPARFREVVGDPVNLLIERCPLAGTVANGLVMLHNGLSVPVAGSGAYYGDFSQILVVNRGVHEPLEEYVFQEVLPHLPEAPVMVELGAYWAHYSMWLRLKRPAAQLHLVEPDLANLQVGLANLNRYRFAASACNQAVSAEGFQIDSFREHRGGGRIDILHSDIQGAEGEMLEGARRTLAERAIDYIFVSTHGEALHREVAQRLAGHGYRVEIDSSFEETTSYDGLVFATNPTVPAVMAGFKPLSRTEIARLNPVQILAWVQAMHHRRRP